MGFNTGATQRRAPRYSMLAPNLKSYLELPIQVQHFWEAYPEVDDALIDLESGNFLKPSLLTDAVFTDDRVAACTGTRINAIFASPMEFKWKGQDDSSEDAKDELTALKRAIAEKCERQWERMFPAAALREIVRWGLFLNVGLGQLRWAWDEDDQWLPILKTWNPQFLYWRWDTRSYWLIHQGGQSELSPGDGKWMLFSPMGHNHGWLYGLIRALGKLWIDRVFTFRDWSRLEEKLGLGIMLADLPANASDADKKKFLGQIADPAAEATVILPKDKDGKGFDLRMLQTSASGNTSGVDAFKERVKQLDDAIAICMLGQNLTTNVSGSSGSRAAAQVHENVRGDLLKADIEVLSSVLCAQVLTPWVKYNWGEDAAKLGVDIGELVPEVTWVVDPPEDKAASAKALADIANALPALQAAGADVRALLEKHDVPTADAARLPDRPPPADVDERPREDEDPLNPERGTPVLNSRAALKPGARAGQVYVDEVVDDAKAKAAAVLSNKKETLLHICLTSKSYDEMRQRLKAAYQDMKPDKLRKVLEHALQLGELAGHLSAREDRNA